MSSSANRERLSAVGAARTLHGPTLRRSSRRDSPGPSAEPTLTRWGRRLGFPLVGTVAVALVAVLLGSALSLAPPPGHFYPVVTSPTGVVRVVPKGTLETFWVNFTGGEVSTSQVAYNYHLYWFFGQSNGTGNISVVEEAIAPPTTCTITTNCSTGTTVTINREWNATGSYDVSVTIYDGRLDYTIYTFVVTVVDPAIKVVLPCFGPPGLKNNAGEGTPIEYWALGEYVSNNTRVGGLTYVFNWGDGRIDYGVPNSACFLTPYIYAQHSWNDSGSYIVTVSAYDTANGLAARVYWEVNVTNPAPQIAQNPNTLTPIAGVQPTATVNNPVAAWACATDVLADLSRLNVLWNFGDGPDSATSGANAGPCWYNNAGVNTVMPGTLNFTTTHAYSHTGTFHYTIKVEDEEGAIFNGTPSPNTVVVSLGAHANATTTLHQTIGAAVILDAANLTSLSTPTPQLNYTWVGGGAKSYGPQSPATAFVAGTQTVRLYINNTTTGAAIISNTQAISWATPTPNAGLTFAGLELGGAPFYQITSNAGQYSTIGFTVYCDGTVCGQAQMSAPNALLNLPIPTLLPFAHSVTVTVQFSPNPSYPNAFVSGQLVEPFASNTSHPVVLPHVFQSANPGTWNYLVDVMASGRGQPVYLTTQMFSPAADALTTTWAWGDGTTSGTYTSTAGPSTAPTLFTYQEVHTWAAAHLYTLLVTVQDGTHSQARKYAINEIANPTINDTAPTASLSARTVFEDAPAAFSIQATEQNPHETGGSVSWTFGDGGTGQGSSTTFRFHFGGKYATAAYVYSPNGTSTVAWAWISVKEPVPVAGFRTTPSTVSVDLPVRANATASAADSYGAYGLTYYWNWGDGTVSGGGSWTGMGPTHVYGSAATYRITLTVIDNEGLMASTSSTVTVNPLTLAATLPATFTETAGLEAVLSPTFTSLPRAGQPFINATWTWNDSSANPTGTAWDSYHWGTVAHHTFAEPGQYKVTVVLTDLHGGSPSRLSTFVNVLDPAPMVLASYADAVVYGENHTADFTQVVLGSWADLNAATTSWTFTWQWGDGSGPTVVATSSLPGIASHSYATSVPATLTVSIQTPWPAAYRSTGVSVNPLFLVPDWDGDGLPNEYETTITHTHPGFAETFGSPARQGGTGNGFTDFLAQQLGVGNPTTDIDGDGLTTLQEMLGSVTGYVSNPLDPNTAGDGIADGAHYFTDVFPATQVVPLPAPGNAVWLQFPNVSYAGFGPAFNSSKLSLEFDTPTPLNLATSLTLTLVAGNGNTFATFYPQNANVNTFYLLNRTPFGLPVTSLGVTLGDFGMPSTWSLKVSGTSSIVGSIASADISVSYYTNPSLADPTFQGMLEGPGLTA
ncbi:MAG: PKD domain-containing protein, partial [Thermoplasmata archaeon]|nr:PKD domain-containing protein [Thermoplasmata archaeon]